VDTRTNQDRARAAYEDGEEDVDRGGEEKGDDDSADEDSEDELPRWRRLNRRWPPPVDFTSDPPSASTTPTLDSSNSTPNVNPGSGQPERVADTDMEAPGLMHVSDTSNDDDPDDNSHSKPHSADDDNIVTALIVMKAHIVEADEGANDGDNGGGRDGRGVG
jgi:hypothetical protein